MEGMGRTVSLENLDVFMQNCDNEFDIEAANLLADRLLAIATNPDLPEATVQAFGNSIGATLPSEFINRAMMMRTAIERVRGSVAATMTSPLRPKNPFMERVFDDLVSSGLLYSWVETGTSSRVDYSLYQHDANGHQGSMINVEGKGGLDGNSTKISEWNPAAVEMWKWHMLDGSMVNSPPVQVTSNRYVSDLVKRYHSNTLPDQLMNGFFVLDYICGSELRPCPKQSATVDILSRIDSAHNGWESPFPDFILLPRVPFSVSTEDNEIWNNEMPSENLIQIFSGLWGIPTSQINQHVHEIHVQILGSRFRYRIVRRGTTMPWHTSAWRSMTR